MKNLMLGLVFIGGLFGQVVTKQGLPPQPATPSIATLTSGAMVMVITGDTLPAVNLTFTVTYSGSQIAKWTEAISNYNGESNTFSYHSSSVTWAISKTGILSASCLVNGANQSGTVNF